MTERNLKFFIEDIIKAIYKIEKYTGDFNFEMFKENELVIDAVIRNLTVIGEASKHIPKNIREEYSNLPWKRIVGLRNIATHGYFKIDLKIIWEIIKKNIPSTKEILRKIEKISSVNVNCLF